MYRCKVIKDSIGLHDRRLSTVEVTYPRCIHSEFLTHRDRARNSASSRAIPWKKHKARPKDFPLNQTWVPELINKCMMNMILTDPFIPVSFDMEQKGMQSGEAVANQDEAIKIWLEARDNAVKSADKLAELGVHKSICNRLTEPFMWITVIYTATEWNNFFRLRCHPDAEKHFQIIAGMMRDALAASKPKLLPAAWWHMPYVEDEEEQMIAKETQDGKFQGISKPSEAAKYISAGRCARVSYLTHDGRRDTADDVALAWKLINRNDNVIHASPLEHVAQCLKSGVDRSGPFRGWKQFRKEFANECLEG
jgi:hypothetical protein